jgi:hypothetical protein
MGMRREVHTGFWWENLKERHHLQNLDRDGRIILMDLKELGMSSSVSGLGPVVVSYDRSNKTSASFRVCVIFWFLYFDLFQVKVQLVSKRNDGLHCYLFYALSVLILA